MAQIYAKSTDRHVIIHLIMQLELLPGWVQLAAQRVGDHPGPSGVEFEVTNEELDWCEYSYKVFFLY